MGTGIREGKFWVVRALGPINPNHELEEEDSQGVKKKIIAAMFPSTWFRSKHKKSNVGDRDRYSRRIMDSTKSWEVDPDHKGRQEWQYATSAMFGFKSGTTEDTVTKKLCIPGRVLKALSGYLETIEDGSADSGSSESDE